MKKLALPILIVILIVGIFYLFKNSKTNSISQTIKSEIDASNVHPLAITKMRQNSYPGSEIKIEEELAQGVNYRQYIASYTSDSLKIYALLTVPTGQKPEGGWPAIVFNHGYIAPEVYRTNERYGDYVNGFASKGYIVFKPDYRGNGDSEGEPEGAYYSPAYTTDVLNALASVEKFKDANRDKIGMWGHSLGGNITLRSIEISNNIKAAVIWAGVVGSYDDLQNNWRRRVPFSPSPRQRGSGRQAMLDKYKTPKENPQFWDTIDPVKNLNLINTPIQLHHGTADDEVPLEFSAKLEELLKDLGKTVELYTYEGADHNLSAPFNTAMQRSVAFFDKYLK